MAKSKVNFEVSGVMTKNAATDVGGIVLMKVDIKVSDLGDINGLVRELDRYGVTRLQDTLVIDSDTPWSNITIPLSKYNLFFNIDMNRDEMYEEEGSMVEAKLDSMKLTFNEAKLLQDCVLSFIKPPEAGDSYTQVHYLKKKAPGGAKIVPIAMSFTQIDAFVIGNEPSLESDSDVMECVEGIEVHHG